MALTAYATASWSYPSIPNFRGRIIAGDPTIVVDGGIYRMFYTDGVDDGTTIRPVIAEAVSADGLTWTPLGGTSATGMVLGGEGGDKANLEGAGIFKAGDTYVLLYSTYADVGDPVPQFPASLYAATSADGVHFTPVSDGPVLSPTAGWYDNDAIYSPTVVAHDGGYLMLYCGHAYTDASAAGGNFGVSLLAAVSSDGLSWTKSPSPVLRADPALSWMSDGASEPSMILGPDGNYYLFFTGLAGEDRTIGLAVAADPLGPWEVNPQPIITAQSAGLAPGGTVIAPHAELVNGVLRLWYAEVTPDGIHSIAYAESDWGGGSSPGLGEAPHWLGTSIDDTIAGTDGIDRVTAAGGDDVVVSGNGGDIVDAGEGHDQVWADAGDDSAFGRSGDDVLYTGDGADTADGGDGADIIAGEAGGDILRGGLGNDIFDGGDDSDTVDGGADDDAVWAGTGNDFAFGSSGDDQLYMDAGADTADGGDGSDILAGEAGADILRGGLGNDILDGGDDSDTVDGGANDDAIWAGTGDDVAFGSLGDDQLYMDAGADTADGGDGSDILAGDAGNDRLIGGLGNDVVDGGADADTLDGGAGVDVLFGGVGDDRLDGGPGIDTLVGGAGNDTYIVDDAGDVVGEMEGEGIADRVYASVDYVLTGFNVELLWTNGVNGTTSIDLTGNAQANKLYGNAGSNILDGGFGSDTITGYGGADSFVFRDALDTSNIDRIADFNVADDTIWLENAIFREIVGTGTLTAAQFRANASGLAADSSDRVVYETDTGKLFYDSNGNAPGGAVQFGLVTSGLAITNADFLIV